MRTTAIQLAEGLENRRFERMVERAVKSLPAPVRALLDNVEIVVEAEPGLDASGDETFGLYEGTPLTERTSAYGLTLPDKITIFRGPLQRASRSPVELRREIQITVVHELAHHFGMTEHQITQLGYE
jgi:predicted Zn-dependent protease with MMP-like domain